MTHRAALGLDVASRARTNDWSAAAVNRCVTYGHPFPAGCGIPASQKAKGSQCVVRSGSSRTALCRRFNSCGSNGGNLPSYVCVSENSSLPTVADRHISLINLGSHNSFKTLFLRRVLAKALISSYVKASTFGRSIRPYRLRRRWRTFRPFQTSTSRFQVA